MDPNQSTKAPFHSDPWESSSDPPISDRWAKLVRRLKPLCLRKYQMVVLYLDQSGEPEHFRVIGKREEV